MPPELTLTPLDLHWVTEPPATGDLCAHGGLRVTHGGAVLLDTGPASCGASMAALLLLRSLQADHTPEQPLAERIVPCCSHFVLVDADTGAIHNVDCAGVGGGANWWIRHHGSQVELEFADGPPVVVSTEAWCQAIVGYADAIEAFYGASPPKAPADEDDRAWYPLFWAEWHRRRGAAPCEG